MKKLREIQVRKDDASTLMDFVRRLEDVRRVLMSMGSNYTSRLDNEDVIIMLMRKLPDEGLKRNGQIEPVTSSMTNVELSLQILLASSEGLQSVLTTDTDKSLSHFHPLKGKGRNLVEERQITHLESHH